MYDTSLPASPYITGIGFPDRKPFEGNRISHYRAVSGEMELLWKTIATGRPFDDGERIIQDIFRLHAKQRGKRVRITTAMRLVLLRLYGLFHQFKKTTRAIVIPATRFGNREADRDCGLKMLRALEEMGAIMQEDGHWVRKGHPTRTPKAVTYAVNPLFAEVLKKVYQSIVKAGYVNAFLCPMHDGKGTEVYSRDPYLLDTNPLHDYYDYCHDIGHISPYSAFSGGVGCTTCKPAKKSLSEAFQRRDKIRKLWLVPDENIKKLIADKAKLSCHHVGLGPECPDYEIIDEIRRKYHFAAIEKSIRIADASLPAEYRTYINVKVGRDRHGNVHKIGCRPYNILCGTKNEEKPDSVRPDVLAALGLNSGHIDVKCSIYTVASALKSGRFIPKDIYSAIAGGLGEERKTVKLAMMKANFGAFAGQAAKSPFCRRAQCKLGGTGITYGEFHREMRRAGIEPMGTDTSIFFHEGAIYGIARRIFLERHGIRSICVYDSFYFGREVHYGLFGAVMKEALAEYLRIIAA